MPTSAAKSSSNEWHGLARGVQAATAPSLPMSAAFVRCSSLALRRMNVTNNIRGDEFTIMRECAADWVQFDDTALQQALHNGRAEEVHCGQES